MSAFDRLTASLALIPHLPAGTGTPRIPHFPDIFGNIPHQTTGGVPTPRIPHYPGGGQQPAPSFIGTVMQGHPSWFPVSMGGPGSMGPAPRAPKLVGSPGARPMPRPMGRM